MNAQSHTVEERLARLEEEVSRCRDILAIQEVIARYSRALDWLDDEMLETVFYDDAEIDFGFFKGTGKEFKPYLMGIQRDHGRRWHYTAQVSIQLRGDMADVESYNFAVATVPLESNPPAPLSHAYGFYLDTFLKRSGRWGIIRRKHTLVAGFIPDEVPFTDFMKDLNLIGDTRSRHPDYRRLASAEPLAGPDA